MTETHGSKDRSRRVDVPVYSVSWLQFPSSSSLAPSQSWSGTSNNGTGCRVKKHGIRRHIKESNTRNATLRPVIMLHCPRNRKKKVANRRYQSLVLFLFQAKGKRKPGKFYGNGLAGLSSLSVILGAAQTWVRRLGWDRTGKGIYYSSVRNGLEN